MTEECFQKAPSVPTGPLRHLCIFASGRLNGPSTLRGPHQFEDLFVSNSHKKKRAATFLRLVSCELQAATSGRDRGRRTDKGRKEESRISVGLLLIAWRSALTTGRPSDRGIHEQDRQWSGAGGRAGARIEGTISERLVVPPLSEGRFHVLPSRRCGREGRRQGPESAADAHSRLRRDSRVGQSAGVVFL